MITSYARKAQQGVVLFVVLIVLVAMTIGAVALMRSVETSNLVSGNFSFKMAALGVADSGVEAALTALPTILSTSLDAPYPAGCTSATTYPDGCRYYSTMRQLDSKGAPTASVNGTATPTAIDWSLVQYTEPVSGYQVRYIIDRLCNGSGTVTDLVNNCLSDAPASSGGASKKQGSPQFSGATTVYYRITVKVEGPRSTDSYVQVIVRS